VVARGKCDIIKVPSFASGSSEPALDALAAGADLLDLPARLLDAISQVRWGLYEKIIPPYSSEIDSVGRGSFVELFVLPPPLTRSSCSSVSSQTEGFLSALLMVAPGLPTVML
jgi:hypothetical protein